MDMVEAARRLGVAAYELVDIKAHAGWWHVLHHDMASHEETWRDVPGAPAVADDLPATEPGAAEPVTPPADPAPAAAPPAEGAPVEPAPADPALPELAATDPAPVDDDPDGPGYDVDGDGVPDGSARQILAWVDGDRDRAAQALAAEQRHGSARTTLVAALQKVIG